MARMSRDARRRLAAGMALVAACVVGACANTTAQVDGETRAPFRLATVDLPRYMGRWYIIANIPYWGERDFVATRAEWKLRDDGTIDDSFFGRKGSFTAQETTHEFTDTVVPGSGNAHWKVRLFFPVSVSQYTLYVDPEYRYTVLGYGDRSLGWIFARERTIPDATYRELLGKLAEQGYDVSKFRKVPQEPDQLGRPGFQSPGQRDLP